MQFKDVVGQNELKHHLIQEINKDKVSHAQLFLGAAGFGALPLALAFIQYLFCENKSEKDSCGVCPSCLKNSELQHPDVHFSFPIVQTEHKFSDALISVWRKMIKLNPYFNLNQWTNKIDEKGRKPIIGSEESLAIIKKLSLKSFEGNYKVMLIWMAEEMNTTCANKLLKLLEEPPKNTLILLIADNQEYILQTILSRTQIVKIPALQIDEVASFLVKNHEIEESFAQSIAAQADCDIINAIDLLETNENKNSNRDSFIHLMRICYKKEVIQMIDWAEEISYIGKEKQKTFLKYALHMLRQSMLKNYTENLLIKVSKEEEAFLKNFSKFITGNNIFDLMDNFNSSYYHIDRNANAKILFTELCFKIMRFIHFA